MDNPQLYGIRWYSGNPSPMPAPRVGLVATATSFDVNGGISNAALRIGDPITMNSTTGMVTLCQGYEASGNNGNAVLGIVVGVMPYWDAAQNLMVPANALQSDIAWGTLLERQSKVLYIPAEAGIWEIDCDDAVTATTEAAYQAFINNNCDHTLAGASGTSLNPRLDISQQGTATAQWRIEGVSPTLMNRDFSGNYVKLLVSVNEGVKGPYTATGT
jgi:hypothetical protein